MKGAGAIKAFGAGPSVAVSETPRSKEELGSARATPAFGVERGAAGRVAGRAVVRAGASLLGAGVSGTELAAMRGFGVTSASGSIASAAAIANTRATLSQRSPRISRWAGGSVGLTMSSVPENPSSPRSMRTRNVRAEPRSTMRAAVVRALISCAKSDRAGHAGEASYSRTIGSSDAARISRGRSRDSAKPTQLTASGRTALDSRLATLAVESLPFASPSSTSNQIVSAFATRVLFFDPFAVRAT